MKTVICFFLIFLRLMEFNTIFGDIAMKAILNITRNTAKRASDGVYEALLNG